MLTLEFAKEVIRAKVEAYGPEHKVEAKYVKDGKPHCIVGHVLYEYGVSIADLSAAEGVHASAVGRATALYDVADAMYRFVPPIDGLRIGDSARSLLEDVQDAQDDCHNWSRVLGYLDS